MLTRFQVNSGHRSHSMHEGCKAAMLRVLEGQHQCCKGPSWTADGTSLSYHHLKETPCFFCTGWPPRTGWYSYIYIYIPEASPLSLFLPLGFGMGKVAAKKKNSRWIAKTAADIPWLVVIFSSHYQVLLQPLVRCLSSFFSPLGCLRRIWNLSMAIFAWTW